MAKSSIKVILSAVVTGFSFCNPSRAPTSNMLTLLGKEADINYSSSLALTSASSMPSLTSSPASKKNALTMPS
ncbi:hypothetical protein swp_3447 [Shewanella piezotolerans WP3]|uniref:Uncharacterized protein n=1 Tax=Shewanella piezotolerans (strain WP3 / JCM 13877) TaxID=225849 RepID=B8CRY8_SHEPW|nr:hypothetical protein swp_3447 [Shewanella piezotolerans WP3]